MNRLTIHIGLHKTGTTFIQYRILRELEDVVWIHGAQSHRNLMAADFNKSIVISDEGISGKLKGGTYLDDFKTNVNKLKQLYGNPKIVIGFRKHEDFIFSVYKQLLHEKGTRSIQKLFNAQNTGLIKHHELYFSERIELLKSLFSDVFIYTQESLQDDPHEFLEALCRFLEVENTISDRSLVQTRSNVGIKSRLQFGVLLKLNKLNNRLEGTHPSLSLYSRFFSAIKLTPRKIAQNYLKYVRSPRVKMNPELRAFIQDKYAEDWSKVVQRISY